MRSFTVMIIQAPTRNAADLTGLAAGGAGGSDAAGGELGAAGTRGLVDVTGLALVIVGVSRRA